MTKRQTPAQVLIVDDHPMVREGLTMRISTQRDLQVCGEAATEEEALSLVKQISPDLVLVDISLKSGHGIELVTVLAGQRYVSPAITQRLVNQALGSTEETKKPMARLTDRELEIFRMIGEGLTSGAIANRLFLSSHTIDTHRENIKRKLNLRNAGKRTRAAV